MNCHQNKLSSMDKITMFYNSILTVIAMLSSLPSISENVKFSRSRSVNDQYEVVVDFASSSLNQNENWTPEDVYPSDSRLERNVFLRGIAKVTSVDADNLAQTIVFAVKEFRCTDDMDELGFDSKTLSGMQFTLQRTGESVELVDDSLKLGEARRSELSKLISEGMLPVFGTQAVRYSNGAGARTDNSWPIEIDTAFSKSLSDFGGFLIDKSFISGGVKLLSKNSLSGSLCYEIEAETFSKGSFLAYEDRFRRKFCSDRAAARSSWSVNRSVGLRSSREVAGGYSKEGWSTFSQPDTKAFVLVA